MPVDAKENPEHPLISFVLFAFNQEQFIMDAIKGALSQTYSPLEIILSDDCSSDRTFDIMQEMVQSYEGQHTLILNQNKQNLHIGGHINKIMTLVKGDLIVVAAGDDISEPERTEEVFKCYIDNGKPICSIYSDAFIIDQNNKQIEYYSVEYPDGYFNPTNYAKGKFHGLLGASHAWHRGLFDEFGPLPPSITFEDDAIPFRASLVGQVVHIPKALVKYRKHENSVIKVKNNPIEEKLQHQRRFIAVYENNLRDLLHYCLFVNLNFPSKESCLAQILRNRAISERAIVVIGGHYFKKIWGLGGLLRMGAFDDFMLWLKYSILNIYKTY